MANKNDSNGESPAPPPRRLLSRLGEPHLLFPILAVIMLVGVWGATLQVIRIERDSTMQTARALTRELTETYEAQVVRVLREIRRDLQIVRYASEYHGIDQALDILEERNLLPPALLFQVTILNPDGEVVASNASSSDLGGSQAFVDHHRNREELQITTVAPENEDEDQWRLRFSQRISDDSDNFAGISVITVEANFFVSSYEQDRMGDHGLLGLVGSDGQFKVRRVGDRVSAGTHFPLRQAKAASESFETPVTLLQSPIDDTERYLGTRELYEFPLTVVAGVSKQEQLAPAAARAKAYLWRAGAGTVLLLVVLALLWRMSHKLAQIRQREMEEREAHARQVEYLAYHDGLTGLPNRSLFTKLLEQAIAQAQRHSRQLAVLFLDLDHFKHINDTLGHDAGDELLVQVAERLTGTLRESDTVARMGGDEFVVLLPEIPERRYTLTVARKLVTAIGKPFILNNDEFRVTTSIGISTYPDDGEDEQTLTKNADVAMYKVKEEGKNNVQLFSEKLQSESLERLTLTSSLRHALENEELVLYYQAKRDMGSGEITGREALLRWQHPDLGLVTPLQFLPIAEETGLIIPIGKWVLRTVCEQNVQWLKLGYPRLPIAVNLTAHQFFNEDLPNDIVQMLKETGMEAELLELEVNENILMQNVERSLEVINNLKHVGVRVTIDNFGVGYSSLTMLKQFPLDSIKIDRTFIRDLADPADHQVLAEAIMAMGKTLGMSVVAQGVETEEQASFLKKHACNEVQGFYYNRPVPQDEFKALFDSAPEQPPEENQTPKPDE